MVNDWQNARGKFHGRGIRQTGARESLFSLHPTMVSLLLLCMKLLLQKCCVWDIPKKRCMEWANDRSTVLCERYK